MILNGCKSWILAINHINDKISIFPAIYGVAVASALLIYTLDRKKVIPKWFEEKDKQKVLLPSLFFLISPFLFTFLSLHTLPGSLQSILPLVTFVVGLIFTENRNQNDLLFKEKAAILELKEKLSINWAKSDSNKSKLEHKSTQFPKGIRCEIDLEGLDSINSEIGKLASFQGLIKEDKRLAKDSMIISARTAARFIEEFNREVENRKNFQSKVESASEPTEKVIYQGQLDETDTKLLGIIINFLEVHKDFQESLYKTENIWL